MGKAAICGLFYLLDCGCSCNFVNCTLITLANEDTLLPGYCPPIGSSNWRM